MQEESGLDGEEDEEKLFKYIEQEIQDANGASRGSQEEEVDDVPDDVVEEVATDINDAEVISPKLAVLDGAPRSPTPVAAAAANTNKFKGAKGPVGKSGGGKSVHVSSALDVDVEEKQLDMSIFDTAEENMSRDLGEDVTGAAAAAAAKKANAAKAQGGTGAAGKKGAASAPKKGKK